MQPKSNLVQSVNVSVNMGVSVFGIKVLAYGTEQIISLSLLQSSINDPWSVRTLSATCVP